MLDLPLTPPPRPSSLKPGRRALYRGELVSIQKWISDARGTTVLATRADGSSVRDAPQAFTPR